METTIILAKSSSVEPHSVCFEVAGDRLAVHCDCAAGQVHQLCKHVLCFLGGDLSMLFRSEDEPLLLKTLSGLDVAGVITDYQALQSQLSDIDRELKEMKSALSKRTRELKAAFARKLRDGYIIPVLSLVLCLLAVTTARAQEKPKVTVEYDRFKDQTTLKIEKTRVAGTSHDDALLLLLVQASPGRRPDPDAFIGLSFFSASPTPHFEGVAQDRELIFLADGQRIRLGDMALVDTKEGAEWVMIGLPLETLMQLAKSKSLEGKVGDREFKLSMSQIAALREFLQHIVPKENKRQPDLARINSIAKTKTAHHEEKQADS